MDFLCKFGRFLACALRFAFCVTMWQSTIGLVSKPACMFAAPGDAFYLSNDCYLLGFSGETGRLEKWVNVENSEVHYVSQNLYQYVGSVTTQPSGKRSG